jgi:hypothetical protein
MGSSSPVFGSLSVNRRDWDVESKEALFFTRAQATCTVRPPLLAASKFTSGVNVWRKDATANPGTPTSRMTPRL